MKSLTSLNCHSDWCPCINSPRWQWWILRMRLSIDHRRLVATEISILPKLCQFIGKHGRREWAMIELPLIRHCGFWQSLIADSLSRAVVLISLWLLSAGSLSVLISPPAGSYWHQAFTRISSQVRQHRIWYCWGVESNCSSSSRASKNLFSILMTRT